MSDDLQKDFRERIEHVKLNEKSLLQHFAKFNR